MAEVGIAIFACNGWKQGVYIWVILSTYNIDWLVLVKIEYCNRCHFYPANKIF